MQLKACLVAIVLAAGVAAGAPAHAEVNVVQVPSAALARGSTYAWAPISGLAYGAPAPAIVNEITARRMAEETEAVLSSKGYRQVADPAEADLIVVYRLLVGAELDANLDARGGACMPFCRDGADYRMTTSKKTQGTLVLDLYDRRTGSLVYRATSEKKISAKDASPERLSAVLKQMTKSLPL